MATDAKIGAGAAFKIGNGASPEVFTAVAEVTSISGPGFTKEAAEATSLDSTNKFREYVPGFKDGGDVTIEFNLLSATITTLKTQLDLTVFRNYQVVFPTSPSKTWKFSAIMTSFSHDANATDTMTGTATFKISGSPTLT